MLSRIVALVPIRDQSRRVPDKNVRLFSGKPLYFWILETLSTCGEIGAIYIDTDSERIAAEVSRIFKHVRIIWRPDHLRSEYTSMNEILLYDVDQVEADYYIQTHCTNPLLRAETISRAFLALKGSEQHDSLFGVTSLYTRLWWPTGTSINHDPNTLLRTQDLLPIYVENSNLYIFTKQVLQEKHSRIGHRPILFEIAREEAWDIDDMLDFDIAQFLHQRQGSRVYG